MIDIKELINELATYALAKKGAQAGVDSDLLETPDIKLTCVGWGEFFKVIAEDAEGGSMSSRYGDDMKNAHFSLQMPVLSDRLLELQKSYSSIVQSNWMERDGHAFMTIPLPPEDDLSMELLKSFIDESYALVWNKLDENGRFRIEAASAPFEDRVLLDQLIDQSQLQSNREEIHQLARSAILLRTEKSKEEDIPLGASKIGGKPDLPVNSKWPLHQDSKPLAFLAQLDLAEIAKHEVSVQGLPSSGLLSIFSVWGWVDKDDYDPQTPDEGWQEQNDWTVILHSQPDEKLKRFEIPENVNSFPPASVEAIPILSLPNHRKEPTLSAMNWSDDLYDQFDEMQSDYRSIQMSYWLKNMNSFASHHLIGGYALFQQEFPDELLDKKHLTMFLQIGSDDNTKMCWGDEGELTFYVDTQALTEGKFERIWGDYQCG